MSTPARHVGLVRAVMQGREGVTGDVLVAAVTEAGGTEARTHRSTGNVSFTARDGAAVCTALGARLGVVLGRPTPVLHRSLAAIRSLVARQPFAAAAAGEHLVVFATTDLRPVLAHLEVPAGLDLVGVDGEDAWFVRRATAGPHPMPLLEAAGVDPLTSRSIGTVEHLAARAG